jgi:hypothetical protein
MKQSEVLKDSYARKPLIQIIDRPILPLKKENRSQGIVVANFSWFFGSI